jgi:subfamily B ATP-binding cassette protein MsbA
MYIFFRPYLLRLFFLIIFTFTAIASTLLLIPLSKRLPAVFSGNSLSGFIRLSAAVTVIYIARGVFTYLQNYLAGYISVKSASDQRKQLYSLILGNSPELFYKKKTGELITILTDDINKIRELLFSLISEFFPSFITLIFTLGYIFYLNWRLSLLVLLLIPAIGGLISLFNRLIKLRSEKIQNRVADSYSALHENFINYTIIKVFGLEKTKSSEFSAIEEHNSLENLEAVKLIALQPSVIGIVQVAGICIIACYGGNEMINNRLSLAELLAFGTALSLTIEPVIYLTKALGIINRSGVSLKRVFDLKAFLTPEPDPAGFDFPKINKISDFNLEISRLSFSYPGSERVILRDISLRIEAGSTIALAGDNGSGKSTLMKLLLRLYNNFSGEIKLGSIDLKNYAPQILRSNFKACFHEPFLFDGNIRENILVNNGNVSEEQFLEVCNLARVSSFVNELADGFDHHTGELGSKLSSGQRQRVALARAILTRPEVLILDEATSALDIETEAAIYREIRNYLPDTTIIIINHRLSGLAFADRIFLLKDGNIAAEGSAREILELIKAIPVNLIDPDS